MQLPPHLDRWYLCFQAAHMQTGVDPYLLAAICDRESAGGEALTPKGPAGTGDKGHGRGLMQIDDRYHLSFIAARDGRGIALWQVPAFNILYAARLLTQMWGSLHIWPAAIAAYNAGASMARGALAALSPDAPQEAIVAALDRVTAHGDYVSDVLRRRGQWTDTPL